MKLFIAGYDILSLQSLFHRIKPRRISVDTSYIRGTKINIDPLELQLTYSVMRMDTDAIVQKKIKRFKEVLHENSSKITQIVLPDNIQVIDEEILDLCTHFPTFYPAEMCRDIVVKGKREDVDRVFRQQPTLRAERRKVHLTQAFGNEFHTLPLHSVDSSLWRRGAEFGAVLDYKDVLQLVRVCNGNEHDKVQLIRHLRPKWDAYGFDVDKMMRSDSYELGAWNMFCMEQYASDIYIKTLGTAYWLTNEERKEIINGFRRG